MDWSHVARFLMEHNGPGAVLDAELKVRFVNAALEALLGVDHAEVEGLRVADLWDAPSLGGVLAEALGPARRAAAVCEVMTRDGRLIELAVDARRVGHEAAPALVFLVNAAHERAFAAAGDEALEYAIAPALAAFGRLVRLRTGSGIRQYWGQDTPRCHEEIHRRGAPCSDCPVLSCSAGARPAAVRKPCLPGEPYRVVEVESRGQLVNLRVHQVTDDALTSIRQLRLRELVQTSGLTDHEGAFLLLLVSGQSRAEISAALGVSTKAVARTQAAIVQKLGTDSRAELLRLLF